MESKTEKIARLEGLLVQTQDTLTRERKAHHDRTQEAAEMLRKMRERVRLYERRVRLYERRDRLTAELDQAKGAIEKSAPVTSASTAATFVCADGRDHILHPSFRP